MKRILEVSRFGFLKELYPERTDWVRLGAPLTWEPTGTAPEKAGPAFLAASLLKIREGCYSHLVLPAIDVNFGHDASRLKRFVRQAFVLRNRQLVRRLAALAIPRQTRVIILDFYDQRDLSVETCELFSQFDYSYFKRELDLNWTRNPRLAASVAANRVRDISLFSPAVLSAEFDGDKENDLFFSAAICNDERQHAFNTASDLAKRGLKVDMPLAPLGYSDYLRRMSKAWLTLSPEGYGWDCYRHYEACASFSVPVINHPRYYRRVYLEENKQCFYYQPGDPKLGDSIVRWLSDKDKLREMIKEGHDRVETSYTKRAIAARLIA